MYRFIRQINYLHIVNKTILNYNKNSHRAYSQFNFKNINISKSNNRRNISSLDNTIDNTIDKYENYVYGCWVIYVTGGTLLGGICGTSYYINSNNNDDNILETIFLSSLSFIAGGFAGFFCCYILTPVLIVLPVVIPIVAINNFIKVGNSYSIVKKL